MALTCCSRQKPLSQGELQSKLRAAESIAAETGMFLDYVRQKRVTNQYAQGHIEYLSSELARTANELSEAIPPAGAEAQFADGRMQVDFLRTELSQVSSRIRRPDELAGGQKRIARIRQALRQVVSSL
jgi:hypothetical protein